MARIDEIFGDVHARSEVTKKPSGGLKVAAFFVPIALQRLHSAFSKDRDFPLVKVAGGEVAKTGHGVLLRHRRTRQAHGQQDGDVIFLGKSVADICHGGEVLQHSDGRGLCHRSAYVEDAEHRGYVVMTNKGSRFVLGEGERLQRDARLLLGEATSRLEHAGEVVQERYLLREQHVARTLNRGNSGDRR